ncbi:DUF1192 domain-containing protein [Roseibium suaedae]|uniref:Uncharacterized small protein, DUF1192 family n=1 Tax=Roseibium suaedae TaxID=735517 RepID=A0A1M7ISC1_9HYPH|nr:DUF1192 domain-containing protein [Roseibium suaedae]SHM43575.1 Uncharacterized small protein, DUF1192 family [Roseibium suaedae]
MFEEETPRKKSGGSAVTVGEDLSRFSEEELAERIETLKQEILRTEETLSQKSKIRDAANAFFGKSPS